VPKEWLEKFLKSSALEFNSTTFSLVSFTEFDDFEINLSLKIRNHPEVRCWMLNKDPISLAEHKNFIKLLSSNDMIYFMIVTDSKYIGVINFKNINQETKSADFGIYANPFLAYKMKGNILLNLGKTYAKSFLKLSSLSLYVYKDNARAIKLYVRNGYEEYLSRDNLDKSLLTFRTIL
jgi:UDP-4-amino-4,6-dideoxy-N-acetyl-beta-L-altrosamine N-acetyltransferase